MRAQLLDAHYDNKVEVDLCLECRLVWFDERESLRMSGLGWVELLNLLQHDAGSLAPWAGKPMGCARCRMPLQSQANVTRYGRFVANRCAAGHGTLQSEALLLAERGLVRGPTGRERDAITAERRQWLCLNCGAAISGDAKKCSHCNTPVLMYDLPRLADSLRPYAAYRLNVEHGRLDAWACHACGYSLDPTRNAACPQCTHPVLALAAADLRPVLAQLEAEWRIWRSKPRPVPVIEQGPAPPKEDIAALFTQPVGVRWHRASVVLRVGIGLALALVVLWWWR